MKKNLLFVSLLIVALLVGCTPAAAKTTGEIKVYTRDASSGTRTAFFEFISIVEATPLTASAIEVTSSADMATKVSADENGIGYTTLASATGNASLLALTYNGVVASEANVINGTYKLSRPFNLVTRASGDFSSPQQEQIVLAFVDFLMNSSEGHEAVASKGGIIESGSGTAWDTLKAKYPLLSGDASAYTIKTGGSTSVDSTLKAALEAFQALTGVKFEMNQTGSGDGFKRTLGADKDSVNGVDIGFASRNFKDTETVSTSAVNGSYCFDAIVVVVNKTNTVLTDVTTQQLHDIYAGIVTKWEDLAK
jgi:phosphate transport system substrate-binding protein